MKKIEVWNVKVVSRDYSESENIHVQASSAGVAARRVLKIAKTNGYFEGYTKREKQALYVEAASFENYVYLS